MNQGTVLFSFTINVSVEDRGDYWAAYIEPLGMTVYGDTESDAMGRVIQAMEFFKDYFATGSDGVQRFRAYLDAHGVPVTTDVVHDDAVTHVQHPATTRIHYPMDFQLGVAAGV